MEQMLCVCCNKTNDYTDSKWMLISQADENG